VSLVALNLRMYEVSHKGKSVMLELESSHVYYAERGNKDLQKQIAMKVKAALKARWIEFRDLTFTDIGPSDTPSGCKCDCKYCDDQGHCKRGLCYVGR